MNQNNFIFISPNNFTRFEQGDYIEVGPDQYLDWGRGSVIEATSRISNGQQKVDVRPLNNYGLRLFSIFKINAVVERTVKHLDTDLSSNKIVA